MTYVMVLLLWLVLPLPVLVLAGRAMALGLCAPTAAPSPLLRRQSTSEA